MLAVTETRDDAPIRGVTSPLPVEDAYLATLHLRTIVDHLAWEAGKQYPVETLREGDLLIRDLKRNPSVFVDQPHHELHFYVSRHAFDAIAEDCEARRIDELRHDPGRPVADGVISALGRSILGAFALPGQANTLFLDHVLSAMAIHLATAFGGMAPNSRPHHGGLSAWQERRAKEMLCENLDGGVELAALARECGVSTGHFRRAFRASTGMAPHQWLLRRRVEAARAALRDPRQSLADIALACGFADQSHFTRVFSPLEGASPGRWRTAREIRA